VERGLYKPRIFLPLKNRKAVVNPEIFEKHSIVRKVHHSSLKKDKPDYSVEILKRVKKTAILIVTPETGRLPDEMGTLARYISCKSGGLGEVVSALCEGLRAREIDCHLATLNLKKRFQRESNVDEDKWQEIRHKIDPDKVHLVNSSIFANLPSAYAGDPVLNAAEFQKGIISSIIKNVRTKYEGRLILHSHDWMAGGAISAYAKMRGCPILHTIHNVHTGRIPPEMLFGVDIVTLAENIFFSDEFGKRCIDCQATAIKNATLINFVGKKFLQEIVDDYFLDRPIIPPHIRDEVKVKYYEGSALSILNSPSPNLYPERCDHLVKNYSYDDDVLSAKKENLLEFQKRTGLSVNPEAILLYWPSRLDPSQKGIELLEDIAMKFVIEHGDVQIAIIGDGVGRDRNHEEILGRIACASGGKITYHHFSESLSLLGYAAASDVFGASLYEPCGQIDQIGNIFGATATNRDTGGYHDKIMEICLKSGGASHDIGNGFLFQDYDSGGLWYGLSKTVQFHRRPAEIREKQIKRIMKETRKRYDLNKMVDEYVKVYERLNGGRHLA
jgi:glycogen synthase